MTKNDENTVCNADEIHCQEISDPSVLSKKPIVSVRMSTYNHEPYIAQAIEGVVKQDTEYPFELIIGEDCSTDRTREIVLEYQKKYPAIVRVFAWDKNVGMKKNGRRAIKACRGKYMAICEGDDYWTDPLKLQKQVAFLVENEEYGMIYSKAKVFNDAKRIIEKNIAGKDFNNKELLLSNIIPTLTTMFRYDLYQKYIIDVKLEKKNWKMGDYPRWLWFLFNAKIYFLPEITGVYRLLTESASHSSDPNKKYEFRLNAFHIADYYAKRYCCNDEYEKFLEYRYLLLYLFCVEHNIPKNYVYIRRLRRLKKLSRKTILIIAVLYNLKTERFYYLIFKNRFFSRFLHNWGERIPFWFSN